MTISAEAPMLSQLDSSVEPTTRWFSSRGCVIEREDGRRDVFVGGTLVGSFDASEPGPRNLLLVELASNADMHLERLAEAFGISSETLRLLRRAYEQEGIGAIWGPALGRQPSQAHAGAAGAARADVRAATEREGNPCPASRALEGERAHDRARA